MIKRFAEANPVDVKDGTGSSILCHPRHKVHVNGIDYILLETVDTPVILLSGHDHVIEDYQHAEQVLTSADLVLAEYGLTLIRSAITLTVRGPLEQPEDDLLDPLEDNDDDDDGDLCELLINFNHDNRLYSFWIPLGAFFVVARLENGEFICCGALDDDTTSQIDLELNKLDEDANDA